MEALISALKYCDDKDAFKEIFLLTKEKVYAYFRKKNLSLEDAQDLTQNVYFRLWKYRKNINDAISVEQHLFQYAKAVFIDHLRTHKKIDALLNEDVIDNSQNLNSSWTTVFDSLDKEKVLNYLQTEPKRNQDLFILNKWAGYSYQQLSHIFSLPVKSIDNYVNKTMKRLRKKIGL